MSEEAVVPVRMSKTLTGALDGLVEEGLYSSRNEALKDSVRSLIERRRFREPKEDVLQAELKAIGKVATALILEGGRVHDISRDSLRIGSERKS